MHANINTYSFEDFKDSLAKILKEKGVPNDVILTIMEGGEKALGEAEQGDYGIAIMQAKFLAMMNATPTTVAEVKIAEV